MRRVFTHEQPAMAGYVCALLQGQGVVCEVRHQYLGGAVGELPPFECWPEVWVVDHQADWALELVEALAPADQPGPDWTCPGCGERVEGQFAICWQCGMAAPVRGKPP